MRIAVISDTHISSPSDWFAGIYEKYLDPADMLIHCGDHVGFDTWQYLLQHKDFRSVLGNTDEWRLRDHISDTMAVEIEGQTIAAVHGWGDRPGTPARVAQAFGNGYDLILHGHTHQAHDSVIQGARLINPGALSQRESVPSLAYLDVTAKGIEASFITI